MLDTIALIDIARTWRAPEHRDLAEIRFDEILCKGTSDAIRSIEYLDQDDPVEVRALLIVMESGVIITVPCNF